MVLPPAVSEALGPLLPRLLAEGFAPTELEQSASFGDFIVAFSNARLHFAIARDRGQFVVHGVERTMLEPAGLWRAFANHQELSPLLVQWLQSNEGA